MKLKQVLQKLLRRSNAINQPDNFAVKQDLGKIRKKQVLSL